MLTEFARVLTPEGLLLMSSPNRRLYSDARNYVNPYHQRELYRDDLSRLLAKRFPAQRWHHQRVAYWSGIWPEGNTESPIAGALERSAKRTPHARRIDRRSRRSKSR